MTKLLDKLENFAILNKNIYNQQKSAPAEFNLGMENNEETFCFCHTFSGCRLFLYEQRRPRRSRAQGDIP